VLTITSVLVTSHLVKSSTPVSYSLLLLTHGFCLSFTDLKPNQAETDLSLQVTVKRDC